MTTFATSTFPGTSGQELHAAESAWVQHPSHANNVKCSGSNSALVAGDGGLCLYYRTETPGAADYHVDGTFTLVNPASSAQLIALCARLSTSADTYYNAWFSQTATDSVSLYLFATVAGAQTQLGTTQALTGLTPGSSHAIKLDVTGTSITAYWDGTNHIGTQTDSSISAAGKAGLMMYNTADPIPTVATVPVISGFSATDATGGGSEPTTANLTGPSTGTTGVDSSNATIALDAAADHDYVFTPHKVSGPGTLTFTPTTRTITTGNSTGTFKINADTDGAYVIDLTDDSGGSLTDTDTLNYTSSTPTTGGIGFPLMNGRLAS